MLGGGLGVGAAVATDGGFAGLPAGVEALCLDVGGPTDDGLVGSHFGVAVLPLDAGGATADFGFGGLDGWDGAGSAGLSSDAFFATDAFSLAWLQGRIRPTLL